ncbi:hypothetical protein PV377_43240, partial [Streptomyces ipomoeae]|nr:hypothetical protein [Streptomyces ipomoeae]
GTPGRPGLPDAAGTVPARDKPPGTPETSDDLGAPRAPGTAPEAALGAATGRAASTPRVVLPGRFRATTTLPSGSLQKPPAAM